MSIQGQGMSLVRITVRSWLGLNVETVTIHHKLQEQ